MMAHGMTDKDQMFSVREAPWHARETRSLVLPDHPNPDEVLQVAGLDWEVLRAPVFQKLEREVGHPSGFTTTTYPKLQGWDHLYRSDTGDTLNVARDTYVELQNKVGAEIMEALLGSDSAVKYETGGSIKGGAQCYLTARVDEAFYVQGDDSAMYPYVVVTWTHDGSGALQCRLTFIRVVCWNTLSMSEAIAKAGGQNFTFRHTKNVKDRIGEAKRAILGVREETEVFQELADELARQPITPAQREDFVQRFIPEPRGEVVSDRVRANISEARSWVRNLYETPSIPETHRDTAYGLLLAGTEYLDHLRGYRNADTYLNRTLLRDDAFKARVIPLIRKVVAA